MNGIDWSTVLNNYGSFAVAVTVLIGGFWAVIRRQTKVLISESAVSAESYKEEQLVIRADIEQLKKSDAEFLVIKNQIDTMQRGQAELKTDMHKGLSELQQDIQDSADRQSRELNGAIDRVQRTMVDYTKAITNRP
jgi:gas vesicle protein